MKWIWNDRENAFICKRKEEKMSDTKKPTYEEKLEALRESIKHWEKDVLPDLEGNHHGAQECPLCNFACDDCPLYIGEPTTCSREGFWGRFDDNRTKENALAMICHMKNLLIEMLDARNKIRKDFPEKKKEEWVDVTEEIEWKPIRIFHRGIAFYYLQGYHDGTEVTHWYSSRGLQRGTLDKYTVQIETNIFRILKKA